MTTGKLEDAAHVVFMLMGDDNAGEIGGQHAEPLQAALSFADRKSAIQHDGSTAGV
jgi:hypothetical protein